MDINLFANSLLKETKNFKSLRCLFNFINENKSDIKDIKLFFDNSTRIFDIINSYFINSDNIEYTHIIEVNNRSNILINSKIDNIDILINSIKISIEYIKLNKIKLDNENIDNIIDFSIKILNHSMNENSVLNYTIEFCNRLFNTESIFIFLYNKDEAIITHSYNDNEILGIGYSSESKLGIFLDKVFNQKKALSLNNLELENDIYNSLGQLSKVFIKNETIIIPLYKDNIKIGILVINNLSDKFNDIVYILTSIGNILSSNIFNIRIHNDIVKNNSYLSNLIKTSIDGIVSMDISGNINLWNEGAKNIFQYEEEEIKNRPIFYLFSSDKRLKVKSQFVEVLNGKHLSNIETYAIKKDGTKFPVLYTFSLITEKNKIIGISIIFRNLTERKRLEKDILESKSRLQAIFDGLNAIIVLFSLENIILMANKEAIKLSKVSAKNLIGTYNYTLIDSLKIKPLDIVKNSKKIFTIEKIFFENNEYYLKFIPVFDSTENIISVILYAQEIKNKVFSY